MFWFIFAVCAGLALFVSYKVSERETRDGVTGADLALSVGLGGIVSFVFFLTCGMVLWGLGQLYFWILFL